MVIKENIKEKKIANKLIVEKFKLEEFKILFSPKILTAAKVGIDNRNDILPESNLLNLKILAAEIVIPDLLTPGIKESI